MTKAIESYLTALQYPESAYVNTLGDIPRVYVAFKRHSKTGPMPNRIYLAKTIDLIARKLTESEPTKSLQPMSGLKFIKEFLSNDETNGA